MKNNDLEFSNFDYLPDKEEFYNNDIYKRTVTRYRVKKSHQLLNFNLTTLESIKSHYLCNNTRQHLTIIHCVVAFNARLFRLANNFSERDIALLMGDMITYSYKKRENGISNFSTRDVYHLSKIYDVSPNEFFVDRISKGDFNVNYEDIDIFNDPNPF